jgi:hypothetical protein
MRQAASPKERMRDQRFLLCTTAEPGTLDVFPARLPKPS